MPSRRAFNQSLLISAAGVTGSSLLQTSDAAQPGITSLPNANDGEDIFAYIKRISNGFDQELYKRILGAANEFKEGDEIIGVAASDDGARQTARQLLANTRIHDLEATPTYTDDLYRYISRGRSWKSGASDSPGATRQLTTLGQLKDFLLENDEEQIKALMPHLSSDVIGCVVKLLSNSQLIQIGAKVFNPLPGSQIGARGYLGARIQPNSPTDNIEDIRWQVLNGWSFAVGDVLLGTNPVSSNPESVAAIELALQDLLETFGLTDAMPHCVLAHIDVQAEVEKDWPGSTELWFQSIAGCDSANATFDISLQKMRQYAASRSGQYGLYFETGQGADFTNGHAHGFDMVLHESRKYGFARELQAEVRSALDASTGQQEPWVHLNDVAGFIGPEVFRTKEQLVRCCLEDIVMGKLHGLCLGLDVCSTLHMDVSLRDLEWCLTQIAPACPAYLMALPTNIDPMLGYLTTSFQDHVRIRNQFGTKVNDRMWRFFKEIKVINDDGSPTEHFGKPAWIYEQYLRRKGDQRSAAVIQSEATRQLNAIADRGVFIANGAGKEPWAHTPELQAKVDNIYAEAKKSIWAELKPEFAATVPNSVELSTNSTDRNDYILHPESGEQLSPASKRQLHDLSVTRKSSPNVQIVISDGLNALAISEQEHLPGFLPNLLERLHTSGFRPAKEKIVVRSGRVRAGYRIGELLFGGRSDVCSIVHLIGERPGTGHHTFSAYITSAHGSTWAKANEVDHNITKVVSGIAATALLPAKGANETFRLLAKQVAEVKA